MKGQRQSTRLMRRPRETPPSETTLRFSPTAWAKLLYLRDRGNTEVGGFALAPADDLLFVGDIQLVRQTCSLTTVTFDDESVADFFDQQVDRGLRPEQFARIWVHTHPGDCPQPSLTDERTFERVFSRSQWAVMFILACGGQTYARLRFNVGPGVETTIAATVDYSRPFEGSDVAAWEQEYQANVAAAVAAPLRLNELYGGDTEEFLAGLESQPDHMGWFLDDDRDFDFERFFPI
jgi:proteasome lid subunit RPN8/RPN11